MTVKELKEAMKGLPSDTPVEVHLPGVLCTRIDAHVKRFECKVCGATPDAEGTVRHGRGCYTQSEDGGGESYEEPAVFVISA